MTEARQNYEQFRKVFSAPNLIITSLLAQGEFRSLREFISNPPSIKLILIQDRKENDPVQFRVEYSNVIKTKWLNALRFWCAEINRRLDGTYFTWVEDTNGTDYYIEIDGDPLMAYTMIGTPKIAGKKNPNYEEEFPTKLRFYALGFLGDQSLRDAWDKLESLTPTQVSNQFNRYVEEMMFPDEFCTEVFYPLTSEYLRSQIDTDTVPPKHLQLALDWFYGQQDNNHHAMFAHWVHGYVDTSLPESCFANLSKEDLIGIATEFVGSDDLDQIVQDYYRSDDANRDVEESSALREHKAQLKAEDAHMLKTRRIQLVHKWKVSSDVVAFLTDDEADAMWCQFENGEIHND